MWPYLSDVVANFEDASLPVTRSDVGRRMEDGKAAVDCCCCRCWSRSLRAGPVIFILIRHHSNCLQLRHSTASDIEPCKERCFCRTGTARILPFFNQQWLVYWLMFYVTFNTDRSYCAYRPKRMNLLNFAAGRACGIKIHWGAWPGLLSLSSVWLLQAS